MYFSVSNYRRAILKFDLFTNGDARWRMKVLRFFYFLYDDDRPKKFFFQLRIQVVSSFSWRFTRNKKKNIYIFHDGIFEFESEYHQKIGNIRFEIPITTNLNVPLYTRTILMNIKKTTCLHWRKQILNS